MPPSAVARPTAVPARAAASSRAARPAPSTVRSAIALATLAMALALGTPAVRASPLGPLTAQSLRGEPLRAVIELPGTTAPAVRLAPAAGYARFGLVRDPALDRVTLRPVLEPDGKRFLRVETEAPVDAAELVLLLEADAGTRRAYRLRLDSPEPADRVNVRGVEPIARLGGSPAIADPGPVDPPGRRPAGTAERSTSVRPDTSDAARTAAAPTAPAAPADTSPPVAGRDGLPAMPIAPPARPESVEVPQGTTLDELAAALRPPGATVEQSAFALWRANPRGFAGRPPRPIPGSRLAVPTEADVLAVAPAEARDWVAASAPAVVAAAAPAGQSDPGAPMRAGAETVRPPTRAVERREADAAPAAAAAPKPVERAGAPSAAASGPAPRAAASRPAPAGFDVELAETLRRTRELQRRVEALKAGFEETARREETAMRALIDTTRRAAAPPPR